MRADEYLKGRGKIEGILCAWGLELHPILGDGNCCFSAFAFGLITNREGLVQQCPTLFSSHDLDYTNLEILSVKLRELAVNEWRENEADYAGFLTESSVRKEAERFSQSGCFDGQLGDTTVLALSNVLGLPLIIITSIANHAVISIIPRQVLFSFPIYLTYSHCGPGHYDGIIATSGIHVNASAEEPKLGEKLWKKPNKYQLHTIHNNTTGKKKQTPTPPPDTSNAADTNMHLFLPVLVEKMTSKGNLTAIQCKRSIRLCAIVHVTMVAKDALTYVDVGIATTAWVSQSR